MFIRKVTVTENRRKNVYVDIFDEHPTRGRKVRPIARLGPINTPAGNLDPLVRGLREFCQEKFLSANEICGERIASWGPVLIARRAWDELELGKMISAACGRGIAEVAFALTANRLVDPGCQRGMDNWLERVFLPGDVVCGSEGDALRKSMVRSESSAAIVWDKTLTKLATKRLSIEAALFDALKPTCLDGDRPVLYQLSSTFVQRVSPRRQLTGWPAQGPRKSTRLHFGVITCGGWPLGLRFFGSSEPEVPQIKRFIKESQRRFGFQKILFAASSGMEEEKLRQLESEGIAYLVGVRRRRDPKAIEVIQEAGRQWVKIDANTKVQEVLLPVEDDASLPENLSGETASERYFLVHNGQEEKEERALRTAVVNRALKALKELKADVESGRIKKPVTIMARAERILAERKGYRHISARLTPEGRFEFWKDERKSSVQRAYEGISLFKTTDTAISPSFAVAVYEELHRLETAFDTIHDTAAYRTARLPLPDLDEHTTDAGPGKLFAGHLLISQLAYFLQFWLGRQLLEKKIAMPLRDAIAALETLSLAELRVGEEKHLVASPGNRTARRIVRALGIGSLRPLADAPVGSQPAAPK
jgi:hypothetical protein